MTEMTTDISDHLGDPKEALTKLPPTGPQGFEGLIGATLSEIAGIPFRLASSGSQFGIDGSSAHSRGGICFKCKR